MTLLNNVNVGGTDYRYLTVTAIGSCDTPAGTEIKQVSFTDDFQLVAGVSVAIRFTYANTYGDGSTTYPKLQVNGTNYPIKTSTGSYAASGAWINTQTVTLMFDGTAFVIASNTVDAVQSGNMNSVTSNAVAQYIVKLGSYDSQATLKDALTTIFNSLPVGKPITLSFSYAGSFVGTAFRYLAGDYYGMINVTRNDGINFIYYYAAGTSTLVSLNAASNGRETYEIDANTHIFLNWVKRGGVCSLNFSSDVPIPVGTYYIPRGSIPLALLGTSVGGFQITWGTIVVGYGFLNTAPNGIFTVVITQASAIEGYETYVCAD